jgi:transposase
METSTALYQKLTDESGRKISKDSGIKQHHFTQQQQLFSILHGTFTKTFHILVCKTYLNNLKEIEIIHGMHSKHSGIT